MEDNIFITFFSFFNFEIWTSPRSRIKKEITLVPDPRVSWGGSSSPRQASRSERHRSEERKWDGGRALLPGEGRAERARETMGKQGGASRVRFAPPQVVQLSLPPLPCPPSSQGNAASTASPAGRAPAAPFHPHIHSSPWLNNPQRE